MTKVSLVAGCADGWELATPNTPAADRILKWVAK